MFNLWKKKPPKQWWTYHVKECGTKYRGCAPSCPKDNYERTGVWKMKLEADSNE